MKAERTGRGDSCSRCILNTFNYEYKIFQILQFGNGSQHYDL